MFRLKYRQVQRLIFTLVDPATGELWPGLAPTDWTPYLSQAGSLFAPSGGVWAEIGNGYYSLDLTAMDTNFTGELGVQARLNSSGEELQNLVYEVQTSQAIAIAYTYTLLNSTTLQPIEGAEVWITTDVPGVNIVWRGTTDQFGVARDLTAGLPYLDPGTYQFWQRKSGFTFTNPTAKVVS